MRAPEFIFFIVFTALALTSCAKKDNNIYCDITLNAHCEDTEFVSIKVDNSIKGNFFKNLNTGTEYEYPLFVNGKCTFRILKGVYIFAFDGTGTTPDGTRHTVRCYSHRSPNESVNLLEDKQDITFDIIVL